MNALSSEYHDRCHPPSAIRFNLDPSGDPHIWNHNVNEDEVAEVRADPLESARGQGTGRIVLSQTKAGRYLKVIYSPDDVGNDKRSGITSDPNRAEDPKYIVRLVGQVIRVSVETVKIVKGLPAEFAPPCESEDMA